jgi:RNA polymerase sigma-70 factor (ECF subfamily)
MDSWMFRIMQTTWIDKTRAHARRRRRLGPIDDGLDVVGEDGSRTFAARVELGSVRKAMLRLADDERAVLALVSIDGMTYREAAEALGIPIGTVMSRVARARANLLEILSGPARAADDGARP